MTDWIVVDADCGELVAGPYESEEVAEETRAALDEPERYRVDFLQDEGLCCDLCNPDGECSGDCFETVDDDATVLPFPAAVASRLDHLPHDEVWGTNG